MKRGAGQVVAGVFCAGVCTALAAPPPALRARFHAPGGDGPVMRVLVDNGLRARTVQLVGLDDHTISYMDVGGLIRAEPFSEFVALLPADGQAPSAPMVGLWLRDGQRLAGDLRPGEGADGLVRWMHPALGALDVPLESLAAARLLRAGETAREPAGPPPVDADAAVLVNGDIVAGFVQSIGTVTKVEVGGEVRAIERDRIARVQIANPPAARAGTAVWLADGSVVVIDGVHTGPTGVVRVHPALDTSAPAGSEGSAVGGGREDLRVADIVAVAFDAARIVPLATLTPSSQRAVGRAWAAPITGAGDGNLLWAGDLSMPGPMVVTWDLPPGATRLWMTADLPADMWTWGDCDLVVSVGEAEAKRTRLWAEHATEDIVVDLPATGRRVLTITLEPGNYGPIQDRVVLRRPLLLRD
ncbi:MAG: hypothetical protein IT437_04835 [Phycisphaerales bacterium]|nr:hypothetical protein [Phycisphaerales bacterium]